MQEQGHLCAYCMRRIPDERILQEDTDLSDAYLEHWQSRSSARGTGENKGLDYQNLLAVCSGNEKAPGATGRRKGRHLTCDKKRGNAPLTVNPLDAATLATISYTSDGKIRSKNRCFKRRIFSMLVWTSYIFGRMRQTPKRPILALRFGG